MTGWRLGWSIWPKKLYEHANKLCVNDHSCPNIISQYAGLEALKDKGVALVPGTSFGSSAKNFVRLSYANSMENLEKAIYRLSTI